MCWLQDAVTKYSTGIIQTPTVEQMIEWCTNALETIEPPLVLKSFESTGILRPLSELFDQQLLAERLFKVVENYFAMIETAVNEEELVHFMDSGDQDLKDMCERQELVFEAEKERVQNVDKRVSLKEQKIITLVNYFEAGLTDFK